MKIERGTCILCLENCENFKAIVGNTKNILDILLLKIDFTIITEPLMCTNCEKMLMKCFDFKAACMHTQNYAVSFLNSEDNIKLDLKDVYLSKNVTCIDVPEDQKICGFCMGLVNNCSAVSLDVEGNDMLEKMMKQCLPELDLSIIKKPVICASCHGSLEEYFHFVMNYLIVTEKIKQYCESKVQIEHSSSLQPAIKDETTREVDGNWSDIIKVEEQFCEKETLSFLLFDGGEICDVESTVKLEKNIFDGIECADKDVKNQSDRFMELDEVNNEQQFVSKNMSAPEEESNKVTSIKIEEINDAKYKEENLFEEDQQQFLLNKEIEIKTDEHDFSRLEHGMVLPESKVTRSLHRREKCSVLNLEGDRSNPYIKHTTEKHVSTIMYKCDICLFHTKHKGHLRTHLLTHKDPLEVTMYKCNFCSHQTRLKDNLKYHMLKHKDPLEVTMYKCDCCSFQTKRKHCLKRHLALHENPPVKKVFKCTTCSFQTRTKFHLKYHLLKHKDPSEITMYKCDCCSFQTKHKHFLNSHVLKHKDASEVIMYKCNYCSFQTRHKGRYEKHLLRHQNPPAAIMYKCNNCPFQSKLKFSLKRHLTSIHPSNPS